ncbi:MAG: CoA pyrophosphatase [Bacteroidota bacterium]
MPGEVAHYKMEPEVRRQFREKENLVKDKAKRAAVMAIFYPKLEETYLLLMLRKEYPGVHSKQIGFPGGKVEKGDKDLLETAKRETHEEVGIMPETIEMVKPLTEVYIPPSNFLVQPFLGLYPETPDFILDPKEVEALLEVHLEDFLDETNLLEQRLTTSYAHDILVPAFKLNGYTVWGATAMMLSEVKDLLQQVL